jgi:hypothetical protein
VCTRAPNVLPSHIGIEGTTSESEWHILSRTASIPFTHRCDLAGSYSLANSPIIDVTSKDPIPIARGTSGGVATIDTTEHRPEFQVVISARTQCRPITTSV